MKGEKVKNDPFQDLKMTHFQMNLRFKRGEPGTRSVDRPRTRRPAGRRGRARHVGAWRLGIWTRLERRPFFSYKSLTDPTFRWRPCERVCGRLGVKV